MSTATRTVTVNAAFLREIKEDNRELKELLDWGVEHLRPGRPPELPPSRVARTLGRLCDRLAMHFALEEAYGYFEDALDTAPRLSERADQLRCQHSTLFEMARQLADNADQLLHDRAPAARFVGVANAFVEFHAAFRQHEAEEEALMLDAFNNDIGCGD